MNFFQRLIGRARSNSAPATGVVPSAGNSSSNSSGDAGRAHAASTASRRGASATSSAASERVSTAVADSRLVGKSFLFIGHPTGEVLQAARRMVSAGASVVFAAREEVRRQRLSSVSTFAKAEKLAAAVPSYARDGVSAGPGDDAAGATSGNASDEDVEAGIGSPSRVSMLGSTSSTASKKSSPKSGAAGSAGGSFCFYDVDLSSYESLGRFIGQLRTSRLLETIDGIFVAVGYQPTQPELVTFGQFVLEKTYVINHAAIAYLLQEIIGILVALPGAGRGVLVGVAATKADISTGRELLERGSPWFSQLPDCFRNAYANAKYLNGALVLELGRVFERHNIGPTINLVRPGDAADIVYALAAADRGGFVLHQGALSVPAALVDAGDFDPIQHAEMLLQARFNLPTTRVDDVHIDAQLPAPSATALGTSGGAAASHMMLIDVDRSAGASLTGDDAHLLK